MLDTDTHPPITATTPTAPGAVIGIMGGGQLGRMLSQAASRLGFSCHIFCPEDHGPAAQVSARHTKADYTDGDAVRAFASACDVVTYEFENVPALSAAIAASVTPMHPNLQALETTQDRLSEKTFIRDTAQVPVSNFRALETVFDLRRAVRVLGLPAVLKTRRLGYDGKGQFIIRTEADIDTAWEALGAAPTIIEAFVPFVREVSIVAARNVAGDIAAYPLIENLHKNHILHTSVAPAPNDNGAARALAVKILEALNYVGVLAVEFFELEDGALWVNEIAPRVHNSGHWTQDAGCVDQFELHIRAICGWPLGATTPQHPVTMTNLIGDDVNQWHHYASDPQSYIHLYGKTDPRPGRKMGHINRVTPPQA